MHTALGSSDQKVMRCSAKRKCSHDGLQLLGELGAACRQFARPLESIRTELTRAVFSGYYTSDDGSLQLKQLPYFAVVHRLETEKEHLLREAEGLRAAMQKSKVCDVIRTCVAF